MFHRPRCSDAIILALCQCYVRARPSFASALSPSAANNPETQEAQESERAHHAIARDTEVVLKLRQKATFIFRITSAHPLTLKWGAVRVHAHPHADHPRLLLSAQITVTRATSAKLLHTRCQPMLVRDRTAVVFLIRASGRDILLTI